MMALHDYKNYCATTSRENVVYLFPSSIFGILIDMRHDVTSPGRVISEHEPW